MNHYSSLVGWHVGTCTNTTADMTDNLLLTIFAVTGSTVHGELALAGVLGGGSPFQGTIANGQVHFTTIVPTKQLAITWQGKIFGTSLTGTYVVRYDSHDLILVQRHQQGNWSSKLVRLMGVPNPDDAHRSWVYHDGNEEGPLNPEDFTQQLISGQWPPNAIVSLNDQTSWSTVAAYLKQIEAEAAGRN